MTPSAAIYLFSVLSGAAALVYELLWSRWLELILGSSMQAVSIILATFMAGLAIGGRWGGGFIDRHRNPLIAYGIIEFAIGVCALAVPALLNAVAASPPLWPGGGAALLLQRLLVACSVLVIPATLLGATFPVLVRLIVAPHADAGIVVARLYFANLAGAVTGVLLSGFALIEMLGLRETNLVAVATNFGIAIAALLLARRASFVAPSSTAGETAPAAWPRATRALLGTLFISGLAAMAYEIFWTRILVFQIGSTIYAFALILAIFLSALAAGSFVAKVVAARGWGFPAFAVTQAFMGFGALAGLYVAGYAPWLEYTLLPRTGGWGEMMLARSLIALPVVAPAAFFSGMTIPLAAGLMVRDGTAGLAMGRIYLANTAGAFLGPLFAGFVLIPLIGIRWGIVLIAALQVAVAVLLLRPKKRWPLAAALVGLLALLSLSWSSGGPLRSTAALLNEAWYKPLFYREGQSGTVTVFRDGRDGSRLLDINGFIAAGTGRGYAYMQMMGHLPALLHAGPPREALVIGLGTGATAASLLEHPLERLTVAEIDATVVEAAPYSRPGNLALLDDPRLRLFIEDGRNLLARLPRRYDLIVLEPMPPYYAGVVNLYTEEFYALAASRLNAGGILCQWLPLHLLSPKMLAMVLHSFLPAFDDVLVWLQPGSNIAMMLGVKGSFSLDPDRIGRRLMTQPKVAAALAGAGVPSAADLIDHFVMNQALAERFAAGAPVISDDHPLLEFAGSRAMRYGVTRRYGRENAERLRSCGAALQPQIEEGGGIEMVVRSGKVPTCTSRLKE
ncbi:MAG: fused MFS/spermidine synthase [Mariprofundaceae bacterium]|nr:fused MFS/spermidine synthase [Mariprofundaceae bacterium]